MAALSQQIEQSQGNKMIKYIGIPHKYGSNDCISLIYDYYREELGLDIPIPKYPHSRKWLNKFSTEFLDEWSNTFTKKVNLTDAQDYDIMAFSADKKNLIIHFGMFVKPVKMLHVEEGLSSKCELLSSKWMDRLYGVYRHNDLV